MLIERMISISFTKEKLAYICTEQMLHLMIPGIWDLFLLAWCQGEAGVYFPSYPRMGTKKEALKYRSVPSINICFTK